MKLILSCFFLVLITSASTAQSTYEFLRVDMSARAAALGGAFAANNDDPDIIFYNPAGMGLLEDTPVSFSFVKHLLDINMASLSYSRDFEGFGRFGAAIKYINYGDFTEADEFGNQTGEFSAGEAAVLIGYSNSLADNFYYGINAKYIYSGIQDASSSALAADLGLHYAFPESQWNVGFSVLNLGSQVKQYFTTVEDLPLDIIIGVAKKLEYLPLRLSLDFHKLNEDRDNFGERFKAFSVGAEFTLSKVLRLRLGYDNEKRSELKIGSFAGLAGFNAGIGATISNYRFDYGFSSMGAIGALHRVGLSTTL